MRERDVAPHTVRMVDVAPGVKLEVLDFGGTGEVVVLLAGLGNTGHVFDDLAPLLAGWHHVYAVTRRGFGASSGPATGYDTATRVADDLGALDALGADRAIFIGHSIAGGELSALAAEHPDRVRAVVYIDAVGDNADAAEELARITPPPDPPRVPIDHLYDSTDHVRAFVREQLGTEWPTGEILANLTFDADGHITGETERPDAGAQIIAGIVHSDFTRIECPALVLAAEPPPVPKLLGSGWGRLDEAGRAAWRAYEPEMVAFWQKQRDRVKAQLRGVRWVEYPDAHHYLFVQHQRAVVGEIQQFLAALPASSP
ncbi:MAG TPA: alpha/beta hydrolase [Kofleriaceae bacterium]|nr:alpha/beta hydrolase [Kofleriaceae bacterium]